jgi:tetratricopeptide (TPR) repeat protein
MKSHLRILMIIGTLWGLPAAMMAQAIPLSAPGVGMTPNPNSGDPNYNTMNPYGLLQKHWLVAGQVMTLEGDPVAGVKVVVQPMVAGENRFLVTDSQGRFETEYTLNAELVKEFSVVVDANKKGFQKAHELIDYGNVDKTWAIPITLRDPHPDPELLSQADFVSALAPRLKKLGSTDGLSAKSEKDYARGVEEFLDRNRPDHALGFLTKVIARDPSCVGCRVMLGLAELESGDWDGANRNFSQGLDDVRKVTNSQPGQPIRAVQPGGGRPEPAIALGVMESWRRQADRAAGFFQEALSLAPQDPLALQEMGRMELLLHNWAEAGTYLGKAEAARASPEARLLRAEALLGSNDFDAANQEMTRYLDGRDVKTMPLEVRQVWARIQEKKKIEVAYNRAKPESKASASIDYLHRPIPELKDLEPAKDQTLLEPLLSAVGKNVQEYFKNFPNTVSLEEIHQEKLRHKDKVGATLDQKFRYLCLMPTDESEPGFNEYRADLSGQAGQPQGLKDGYMLTSGFASASLIFHPLYQAESTFKYLGRQKINGQDTLVIAFAQRPEKARLYGVFKMGDTSMPTFSQGLAWVDSKTYEILRLRTDLLRPLPEVRLEKETTEIDFSENHFKSIAEAFWLPREVKVSVDWNGKSLLNKHEYSDFKLFNVGATQKIEKPKEAEQGSQEKGTP